MTIREMKTTGSKRGGRRRLALLSTKGFLCTMGIFGLLGCDDSDPTVVDETHYMAEDYGFDVGRLFHALDLAYASGSVQGVVVERGGTVVGEMYGPDVPPRSLFETWHVTSAVTSLLVGEALESGHLESLDQTLGELLVPWSHHLDDQKAGITLRQLLTMTSGISRPYGTPEEYFEWLEAEDQVAWVLEHPLRYTPGERYRLDSAAAHLLSAVLTQVTGESLSELAQTSIMDPLGMPTTQWMTDANGFSYGGFGLQIRTRDMVKLARLILNEGWWEGEEIASPSWIRESTRPHVHPYPESPEWGFGYLWKSATCGGHPCLYISGYGGQILVAVPDLDLAIALNSAFSEDQDEAARNADVAWEIVLSHIIPSAGPWSP
jgi:CubicO group peptidase (beta-lactamase class C family)